MAPQVISLNEVVEGLRNMMKRLIGEDLQLETFLASGILEGEYDFLEKPFSTDRLAGKVRGALAASAAGGGARHV